jgi:hypothetical protein
MDQQKTKKMKKRPVEEEQTLSEDMGQKKVKKSNYDSDEDLDADMDTPTPEVKPPTSEDGSIKCNPFTFGMLALEFYLCKSCRGFPGGRKVFPKDNGDVYLLMKMCQQCRELNQKMRECFKDTMKKDWPTNSNFA